ncbi:hypothetical protein V8G54_008711 [Vigna mungo]|uniref:Uncharacterized protein n=1 Tax=Vigna mungo TaxID=3915 RepID=A0AAQ3P409_VIGMU
MVRTRHGKLVRREQCKRGVPISMHGHLAVELGNISYGNVLSKHTTSSGQHPPHLPHSSIPSSSTPSPSTPSSSTPSSSTPSPLTPSSSTPSFSTDQRQVLRSSLRSVPLPHHTSTLVLHHTTYPPLHPTFPPTVLPSSAPKVHDTCRQTPFALPVESSHDDVVQPTPATSKHHVLPEEVRRDASGRVIIRPVGKGWTPNRYAVEAIGHAIRSQFEGPYHHYEAMPEDAQLKWWTKFKARVTWAPQDDWIGEQAWSALLNYWASEKFKERSSRNKINRSSARGGALHSTGRKSHLDIALALERKYGRPVEPDELFLATHIKKKWYRREGEDNRTVEDGGRTVEDGRRTVEDGGRTVEDGGRTVEDGGRTRGYALRVTDGGYAPSYWFTLVTFHSRIRNNWSDLPDRKRECKASRSNREEMSAVEAKLEHVGLKQGSMQLSIGVVEAKVEAICKDLQELMRMMGGQTHHLDGKSEGSQGSVNGKRNDGEGKKDGGPNGNGPNGGGPNDAGGGGSNGVGGSGPYGVGRQEEQLNWRKKVELPVFEGFDPLNWINRADKFFELQRVSEEEKLSLAYIRMEGSAGFWFKFWREHTGNRTWTGLKEAMVLRFGGRNQGPVFERLATSKQSGIVEEYDQPLNGKELLELNGSKARGLPEPNGSRLLDPNVRERAEPRERGLAEPNGKVLWEPIGSRLMDSNVRGLPEPNDSRLTDSNVRGLLKPNDSGLTNSNVRGLPEPNGSGLMDSIMRERAEPKERGPTEPNGRGRSELNVRKLSEPNGLVMEGRMKVLEGRADGRINALERTKNSLKWWAIEKNRGLVVFDTPTGGREQREVLKDIEDHFRKTYDFGERGNEILNEEWKTLEEVLPPPKPPDLNWRTTVSEYRAYDNARMERSQEIKFHSSNLEDKVVLQRGERKWYRREGEDNRTVEDGGRTVEDEDGGRTVEDERRTVEDGERKRWGTNGRRWGTNGRSGKLIKRGYALRVTDGGYAPSYWFTLVTFHSRIRNKKNGGWVDGRASETYETYHERLRVIQAESFERSTSDPKQISAVIKIQCWKDVVGGKSKGRVYGTADLAANIRHGVSSLTQPSLLAAATDHIDHSAENEQLRQQVTQANITAREAMERCAKLEDTMQLLKQQMAMMMERQVGDRSTSTT